MAATTVRVGNFMGTGIDLLPLPTTPGYRSLDWSPNDATVSNVSPYSRREQVQTYLGGEFWACTVTLPYLSKTDAANWTAAMLGLRGTTHAFQLADQAYQGPQNTDGVRGAAPAVDGSSSVTNAAGTVALFTRGWIPNTYGVLMPGDFLQVGGNLTSPGGVVGYRYHMVMDIVSADATGKADIIVWPSLRESHADGQPLDVVSPVCLMRRADNVLNWSVDYNGFTSLSFKCTEVR